jgi:hypothetical protein
MCLEDNELLEKVEEVLDKYGVEYSFEETEVKPDDWWPQEYYIDHYDDLEPFLKLLYEDEDMLIRYLFGDTDVFTGNDNELDDDISDDSKIAREYAWDSNEHDYVKNPRRDETKYDDFYKGN